MCAEHPFCFETWWDGYEDVVAHSVALQGTEPEPPEDEAPEPKDDPVEEPPPPEDDPAQPTEDPA